jgi:uncharacterized protein GlcG (DUF336 family)
MKGIKRSYGITATATLDILNQVHARANQHGKAIFVAVVDGSGELCGLLAHDDAPSICRKISQDKAYTAYATRMKTSSWKSYVYATPVEERELMLRQERYIAAAGGCPVLIDGCVAGAVGVSGAGQELDEELAAFGAALAAGE